MKKLPLLIKHSVITAVLVLSGLCHANGQTLQRIYGDNYVGTVNRFEFSGDNVAFVSWEATGNYTWDYFTAGILHVHWNSPGDVYVTAIYNDMITGEEGKRVTYPLSIVSSPLPPAAPSALVATPVTPTTIYLNWADNSTNETGFSVERSLSSGSGFTLIATLSPNSTFYADEGLTPGTQYYYRIRASNQNGNSAYTPQASASTPSPPAPPSNVVATAISYSTINLTWTDNSNNETGFQIVMQAGEYGNYVERGSVMTGANVTSYSDTGLAPDTRYFYTVRAVGASGEYASSPQVSATTFPYPLEAPTNLSATTVSSTQIDLAWTDNSSNETGFQIERSLTSESGFELITTTAANATSYANTGLPEGTRHFYRVRAIDAGGASTYTSVASPVGFTVNAGQDRTISRSSVTIVGTVTPPNAGAINSYVWEEVSGPAPATLINSLTSSLTVTNLATGTYVFRFKVQDVYGIWIDDTITLTIDGNTNNYVREIAPLKPGVLETQIASLPVSDRSESTSYFDGLGRLLQVVNWQASPNRKDVVQAVAYDAFGREGKTFLPYVSSESNGAYKADALTDPSIIGLPELADYRGGKQYSFYQTGDNLPSDQFPYSEAILESSPLNRIIKQGAPGNVWQPVADPLLDRSVKKEYGINKADEVLLLGYDSQTEKLTVDNTAVFYPPGVLYANKTIDEHNNEVIEYVDKQSRVVCKRVQYDTDGAGVKLFAETYYIYDDFGNLVIVLPPEGIRAVKNEILLEN